MLGIVVHSANVQDRDGAEELLRRSRRLFPFVEVIFADGGYQGPIMAAVTAKTGTWRLEIVKRNDVPRFEVIPKRWIVERTLAWISHCRRLARDFERHVRTVVAFIYLAMIRPMLRRLTATRSA
jgi:transposase